MDGVSGVQNLRVTDAEADMRLDRWFRQHFPQVTHGRLEKLLRTGQIRVDGRRVKAGTRLEPGQSVRVPPIAAASGVWRPAAAPSDCERRELEAAVLYRDEWVICLNKPPGLAVQGGTKQSRHLDAWLDSLRYDAAERPRLVHRLDKDTSGVLLLGRTRLATQRLTAAFRSRAAKKVYWAAVSGVPDRQQGKIAVSLAKRTTASGEKVVADSDTGKSAITLYSVVDVFGRQAAWLALAPLTGRTHQLRAHCAALGTPILGDRKYGGRQPFQAEAVANRLHLHARSIEIPHPGRDQVLTVVAPLPAHMAATWAFFGFDPEAGQAAFD